MNLTNDMNLSESAELSQTAADRSEATTKSTSIQNFRMSWNIRFAVCLSLNAGNPNRYCLLIGQNLSHMG